MLAKKKKSFILERAYVRFAVKRNICPLAQTYCLAKGRERRVDESWVQLLCDYNTIQRKALSDWSQARGQGVWTTHSMQSTQGSTEHMFLWGTKDSHLLTGCKGTLHLTFSNKVSLCCVCSWWLRGYTAYPGSTSIQCGRWSKVASQSSKRNTKKKQKREVNLEFSL